MSLITTSSEINVKLIRSCASDECVIQAAQVSIKGENNPDTVSERLIRSLMRNRHGVPFEHTFFTFHVEVPIFVARQWVKHRMSSLNEISGRYSKLAPKFYIPELDRPMINTGTAMEPIMTAGSVVQSKTVRLAGIKVAQEAWNNYETQLQLGVAEEMARSVLPTSIYTQFYWSLNARSLMNFLERRVESVDARVPSHPQWEIQEGARLVENLFAQEMPITHEAFVRFGRVAP